MTLRLPTAREGSLICAFAAYLPPAVWMGLLFRIAGDAQAIDEPRCGMYGTLFVSVLGLGVVAWIASILLGVARVLCCLRCHVTRRSSWRLWVVSIATPILAFPGVFVVGGWVRQLLVSWGWL